MPGTYELLQWRHGAMASRITSNSIETLFGFTWNKTSKLRLAGSLWGIYRDHQGAVSIRKTVLPGMAIPMLKIRRPNGRLIFNMEIAIRR